MRNVLLTSTLLLALTGAAYAQGTGIRSIPNGQNSGVAIPDPGQTIGSVPNGQNSGVASPAPGTTFRSIPNGQNSGVDNPTGVPVGAPNTATGARPGNVIGTGMSEPTSNRSSNTESANASSAIAPRLPTPSVAAGASPEQLLAAARQAIRQRRTGAAQEALERAETRLLDRVVNAGDVAPSDNPMVKQVSGARMALGRGNTAEANQMINAALASR